MAQSNEGEKDESMMEEALNILKQEGFSLPNDVIDTLTEVSRSNQPVRRRGSLRGHRMCEVQSNTRKQRNVRESSTRRGDRRSSSSDVNEDVPETPRQQDSDMNTCDDVFNGSRDITEVRSEKEDRSESSSSCSASTVKGNMDLNAPRETGYGAAMAYSHPALRPELSRQDSESSIASSASSMNRKLNQLGDRRGSSSTDCGYNTSIENAKQVHEARAENLKNMNKDIENKISGRNNNGIKREISRDSGFTENTDLQRITPSSFGTEYNSHVPVVGDSTTEFKDMAISNSDYKEQSLSTDRGEAHVTTSTASDLTATEMTSRNNEITSEGTVVSSASKLADEESNSALSRLTNKIKDDAVTKMEDFESENRRTKSSRNDSISTSPSGVTTASSRHASSMDQELNQENSQLTASNDGRYVSSSLTAAQQLTRNQEMDNIEQSTDGSSKSEHKKTSDKSSLSKSNIEETKLSEDGLTSDTISASQELEAKANAIQNEENTTSADGTQSMKRQDSTTFSFSEKSSSAKKTVKQLPYSGGSSTEMSQKQDSSKVSKSSKSFNEVTESAQGRTEKSNKENSNAMSSSFSGKCESTEMLNGSKLHKTMSTENSSENKVKSVTSNKTYTTSGQTNEQPMYSRERRLSDASNASTLSNLSGLSRENIKPPSYEETMSNLSRAQSNSSLFSRQDSSASSIASSAGAFNERQRQKALDNARGTSFDSNTDVKEVFEGTLNDRHRGYGVARQDSYSSDSTLSGGRDDYKAYKRNNSNNTYDNKRNNVNSNQDYNNRQSQLSGRVINHPIKQVGQSTYSRSYTDSVYERQPNRRATLTGDIILSEREVAEAREEVRSKIRGKDDSYVGRRPQDDSYVSRRPHSGYGDDFSSVRDSNRGLRSGFDSFGREIMDIVDSFFDDDDDFAFGLTSRRRRRSLDRSNEALSRRREVQNPYTVREDLSRYSSSREGQLDSVGLSVAQVEYAASDSGFQVNRQDRDSVNKYSNYGKIISDSASDCGYDRYKPRTVETRAINSDTYTQNRYSDYGSLDRQRKRKSASRDYSGSSSRINDQISAGDNLQSAGKSILRDKKANSSIYTGGDRRADSVGMSSSSNDYNRYGVQNGRYSSMYLNDTYSNRADSEPGMSDTGSTSAYSFRSLPPEVNQIVRGQDVLGDNLSTHSLPDFSYNDKQRRTSGKMKLDDSRRQRIDKALSWIRSELGELRTQDKVLMTQFQRCQESIEQLKKQRPWYEVFSDEEGEDGRHWEDWEIEDFDRSCQSERRDNGGQQRANKSGTVITKEYGRMSIKSTD